jgi:transcription termination/antitermination protein NusA
VRLGAKLTGWRIDIKSEEEKRREVELQFAGLELGGDSEETTGSEGETVEEAVVTGDDAGQDAVAASAAETAGETTDALAAEGVDGGEPEGAARDTVVSEGTSR